MKKRGGLKSLRFHQFGVKKFNTAEQKKSIERRGAKMERFRVGEKKRKIQNVFRLENFFSSFQIYIYRERKKLQKIIIVPNRPDFYIYIYFGLLDFFE